MSIYYIVDLFNYDYYEKLLSNLFYKPAAHKSMIRHLINMGVIWGKNAPAKPFVAIINLYKRVNINRKFQYINRVNIVGIHNINVNKLLRYDSSMYQ